MIQLKNLIKSLLYNYGDLIIILFISTIFTILKIFLRDNIFLKIIGIFFLLYIPGYLLSFIVLPNSDSNLNKTIVFSIFLALFYNAILGTFVIVFSINKKWLLCINYLLIIIFSVIAGFLRLTHFNYKRKKIIFSIDNLTKKWNKMSLQTKIIAILTIISFIGSLVSLIWLISFSTDIPMSTYFTIQTSNGSSIDSIQNIHINQTIPLVLIVENLEYQNNNYFFEVWLVFKTESDITDSSTINYVKLLKSFNFSLNIKEEINHNFNISISKQGMNCTLFFILQKNRYIELPTESNTFLYINEVFNTRIKPVITFDDMDFIVGLWTNIFILN